VTGLPQLVVVLVALQRLLELLYSRRNERRLLAAGGREVGARHYPLFILLHGGWLAALFLLTPQDAPVIWPLLALFVGLQIGRVWVIVSLGRYWTTRIITLPGAPLVQRGPYRWLRHPNYWIVALEITVLPLAFGQWLIALVFTILNLALLRHRVRIEEAALADRRPL
jgi:methyltransferase